MASDGTLIFDAKIDESGVKEGLQDIQSTAEGYTVGKGVVTNLATDAINETKEALIDVVQTGMDFEATMSKVQDAVEWVTEHLDEIIDFAGPVAKALVACFAVSKVTKAIKTITTAIRGIGTALSANPLGAITTALGLLVTLGTAVTSMVKSYHERFEEIYNDAAKLSDEMENVKSATAEAADEWESIKESSADALADENIDYSSITKLKDRLSELVDADGRVRDGAETEVQNILEKINSYTGACYDISDGLITKNGEVAGSYQSISDDLDALIEKSHWQSIQGVYEDDYATT